MESRKMVLMNLFSGQQEKTKQKTHVFYDLVLEVTNHHYNTILLITPVSAIQNGRRLEIFLDL